MSRPEVSVVIATHDRPRLLERAVASMQAQTFEDLEILVVDDASGPRTGEVIRRLEERDPRVRGLRTETNLGPGGTRNLGIARARGELVAILDDDDISRPHRLERQMALFKERPELGLVCSAVEWVDRFGETLAVWPGILARDAFPEDPADVFRLLYLQNNKIPNTTVVARAEILRRFPYAEHLRVGEDWLAVMHMAASGVPMAGLAEPLVLQQRDPAHQSLMSDKERAIRDQRRALADVREWLAEQGIRDFDDLHRRAEVCRREREARLLGGLPGLKRAASAVALGPGDAAAWKTFSGLCRKGAAKVGRRLLGRR